MKEEAKEQVIHAKAKQVDGQPMFEFLEKIEMTLGRIKQAVARKKIVHSEHLVKARGGVHEKLRELDETLKEKMTDLAEYEAENKV